MCLQVLPGDTVHEHSVGRLAFSAVRDLQAADGAAASWHGGACSADCCWRPCWRSGGCSGELMLTSLERARSAVCHQVLLLAMISKGCLRQRIGFLQCAPDPGAIADACQKYPEFPQHLSRQPDDTLLQPRLQLCCNAGTDNVLR